MAIWEIIAGPLFKILDRVIPDPAAKAAAQLEIIKLQSSAEMAVLDAQLRTQLGQQDINKTEAASPSMFVAGWRPAIGWIGAGALSYQYILQPLLEWLSVVKGWGVGPPKLDLGDLITIVGGMLGLGGLRTVEKVKGVTS